MILMTGRFARSWRSSRRGNCVAQMRQSAAWPPAPADDGASRVAFSRTQTSGATKARIDSQCLQSDLVINIPAKLRQDASSRSPKKDASTTHASRQHFLPEPRVPVLWRFGPSPTTTLRARLTFRARRRSALPEPRRRRSRLFDSWTTRLKSICILRSVEILRKSRFDYSSVEVLAFQSES